MDLLRIVIAILFPPLGVFLQVGIGKQFWINILLTILTPMQNRKNVDAFEFSVLLNEDGAGRLELTKA
jgi:hypothetical protein